MKRCFNWILCWFTQWLNERRILSIISIVISIAIGIAFFVSIDKEPPTATDYEALEKQISAIQQNPDLLLKTNCNISIIDDVITVNLKKVKCEMTVRYNQNFQILSISKTDTHTSWQFALALSIVLSYLIYLILPSILPYGK